MSYLNPNVDNFRYEFDGKFWVPSLMEPYNNYLKQMNGPIKNIVDLVHGEITRVTVPGLSIPEITVSGQNNTGVKGINSVDRRGPNTDSIDYISNVPFAEVIQGKLVTVTTRNVFWNYLYIMQHFRERFDRNTEIKDFNFYVYIQDSANVPLFRYEFIDCIVKTVPELELNHGESLSNMPTIDFGIRFNYMNYTIMIPGFNQTFKII